jgi:hypothetical protein
MGMYNFLTVRVVFYLLKDCPGLPSSSSWSLSPKKSSTTTIRMRMERIYLLKDCPRLPSSSSWSLSPKKSSTTTIRMRMERIYLLKDCPRLPSSSSWSLSPKKSSTTTIRMKMERKAMTTKKLSLTTENCLENCGKTTKIEPVF